MKSDLLVIIYLQQEAVVEGGDDDAELEALRARLANVRS